MTRARARLRTDGAASPLVERADNSRDSSQSCAISSKQTAAAKITTLSSSPVRVADPKTSARIPVSHQRHELLPSFVATAHEPTVARVPVADNTARRPPNAARNSHLPGVARYPRQPHRTGLHQPVTPATPSGEVAAPLDR